MGGLSLFWYTVSMPLAYNPSHTPQYVGSFCFPANNYVVVSEEMQAHIRTMESPIMFAGDNDFPELWKRYSKNESENSS